MRIKVDFDGITSAIIPIQQAARADREMRLFANTNLARYCDPYVPASPKRIMSQNINITADFVQYPGPYAHYQYEGVVYGPNIPFMEGNKLIFRSPKNKPKTKVEPERKLQYSRDMHPLAQSHWDKAAMARHKGDLTEDIRRFIARRYRKENG